MRRSSQSDPVIEGLVKIILLIPLGIFYIIQGIVKALSRPTKRSDDTSYFNMDDIDLSTVDSLDGPSFERFIAQLLKYHKYQNVRVTKASGDFGIDVLGEKDGHLWAVQCKCYQAPVGVHAIQEVYSGASKYGADTAVVATNAHFTAAAKEMAHDLQVLLWDREKLCSLINSGCATTSLTDTASNAEISIPEPVSSPEPELSEFISQESNKSDTNPSELIEQTQDTVIFADERKDSNKMATLIGAGKYVFGEDIPFGKYNLKVVSGNGMLVIRHGKTEDDEDWLNLGVHPEMAHEYRNLSLEKGQYFSIDGNLQVEISKSKMLEID